jgi:amidase
LSVIATLVAVVTAQCDPPNNSLPLLPSLLDATTEELVSGLESGSFSSMDLVKVSLSSTYVKAVPTYTFQAYIARIEEVNAQLNAVTEINPDALEIARVLDHERAFGQLRGYAVCRNVTEYFANVADPYMACPY